MLDEIFRLIVQYKVSDIWPANTQIVLGYASPI
jgi:hypothetical protein